MALVKLTGDGQEIPMSDEIAKSDELLKRALAPFYPEVANALIKRETVEGQLIVSLVKQAGSKGAFQLSSTVASPEILLLPDSANLVSSITSPTKDEVTFALEGELPSLVSANSIEQGKGDGGESEKRKKLQQELLEYLTSDSTPQRINPLILAAWNLRLREIRGDLDILSLLQMQPQLQKILETGGKETKGVETALSTLKAAPASGCENFVIPGF